MSEDDIANRIVGKILEVWQIEPCLSAVSLKFQEATVCGAVPERLDEKGRLHVKVYGPADTEYRNTIYHEGAHVYLFHLGYPPAKFPQHTLDFIAEYYANVLELRRLFDDDLETVRNETERMLVLASVSAVLYPVIVHVRNLFRVGIGGQQALGAPSFTLISDWLRQAPDPPALPPGQKFTPEERGKIKHILRDSFPMLYPGNSIEFLKRTVVSVPTPRLHLGDDGKVFGFRGGHLFFLLSSLR